MTLLQINQQRKKPFNKPKRIMKKKGIYIEFYLLKTPKTARTHKICHLRAI